MMGIRPARKLAKVKDPAWPEIQAAVNRDGSAQALPITQADGETCLVALQVTAASALGALALNCGGLLVDGGWLRILGGGYGGLPSIASASGLREPSTAQAPAPYLIVGFDVLGGRFAIDGGGLGVNPGEVCYWSPGALSWEGIGVGHSAYVEAFLSGAATDFYADVRWPGWSEEISTLALDEGISLWPPPFSAEGQDLATVSRKPVPFSELLGFYDDAATQL